MATATVNLTLKSHGMGLLVTGDTNEDVLESLTVDRHEVNDLFMTVPRTRRPHRPKEDARRLPKTPQSLEPWLTATH